MVDNIFIFFNGHKNVKVESRSILYDLADTADSLFTFPSLFCSYINVDDCIAKMSILEGYYLRDSMIIDQPVLAVLLRTFIGIFPRLPMNSL